MKRSEVNRSIDQALVFFDAMDFPLPHWARWSPETWTEAGDAYREVTDNLFLKQGERFPQIEEDEPRRWQLCSEYDRLSQTGEKA